jgi:predicted nucleotidyltransferase
VQKIKNKAIKILGKDVKVLVFGSIVKGNWTPNSDIDVLIISKNLNKNWFENNAY